MARRALPVRLQRSPPQTSETPRYSTRRHRELPQSTTTAKSRLLQSTCAQPPTLMPIIARQLEQVVNVHHGIVVAEDVRRFEAFYFRERRSTLRSRGPRPDRCYVALPNHIRLTRVVCSSTRASSRPRRGRPAPFVSPALMTLSPPTTGRRLRRLRLRRSSRPAANLAAVDLQVLRDAVLRVVAVLRRINLHLDLKRQVQRLGRIARFEHARHVAQGENCSPRSPVSAFVCDRLYCFVHLTPWYSPSSTVRTTFSPQPFSLSFRSADVTATGYDADAGRFGRCRGGFDGGRVKKWLCHASVLDRKEWAMRPRSSSPYSRRVAARFRTARPESVLTSCVAGELEKRRQTTPTDS